MNVSLTRMHNALIITSVVAIALFFGVAGSVFAQANAQINYQGKLTDSTGVAVPDGTYNMRFWLISSSTAATTSAEWTESLTGSNQVQVTNGLFSVMLGSSTALTGVDFNQTLYLGVEIGGTSTPAWDGEMSPRKVLGTVPAAFVANYANIAGAASSSDEALLLGGVASSSFLRSDETDTMTATSSGTLISFIQNGAGAIARFFSGVTEVFTILSNGNVGVGTSTPSAKLAVEGDAIVTGTSTLATTTVSTLNLGTALSAVNGGTGLSSVTQNQILIGGAGNTWTQVATSSLGLGNGTFLGLTDTPSSYTANRILFASSSATSLTDSASLVFDGTNLGLGSTTPSARLTVQGAAGSANIATFASSTGSTTLALLANGNLELGGQLISAGVEWTAQSAAGDDDEWTSVTYGNGLFVAVSYSGDRVMTSSDGINWSTTTAAGDNDDWRAVTYGNGLFVAVGLCEFSGDCVMTSPDGVTWTIRSTPQVGMWRAVTYGNGLFVTVGDSGTNHIMTSPDGITWTARSAAGNDDSLFGVTYGNGKFVAVSGFSDDTVLVSEDGVTWTDYTVLGGDDFWWSVTYGNGLFVAVGGTGGTDRVMTSPDGITWTARTAAGNDDSWRAVTYGNGLFVAVGDSGDMVMTSSDGISWTVRSAADNDDEWASVAFGTGRFVAVGDTDGDDIVMTSGFIQKTELAHNNIYQGDTSFMSPVSIGTTTKTELLTVAGNTYISGNLTALGVTTLTNASTTNLALSGAFYDSVSSAGTQGYVLQSTGTSTRWVATSSLGISGVTTLAGLSDTNISGPATGELLSYDGADWVNVATSTLGLGNGTFLGLSDTPSSYTANRILYQTGAAVTDSANFTFDGSQLSVNGDVRSGYFTATSTTGTSTFAGRVGIGTTTPGNTLTVEGSAAFTGNVGIGTSPSYGFHVNKSTIYLANGSTPILYYGATGLSLLTSSAAAVNTVAIGSGNGLSVGSTSGAPTNGIYTVGSIGVGTSTPAAKLTVVGSAGTDDIIRLASSTGITLMNLTATGRLGLGTTTPTALLSLMGTAGQSNSLFTISSSTGAALLNVLADGSLDIDAGGIYYDASTRQTSIESLNLGAINFADDAGAVSWVDMAVTGSAATGTVMSYSAQLDSNPLLTIYGESAGSGNVQNLRVGIGSTTPSARLTVVGASGSDNLFTFASSTDDTLLSLTASGRLVFGTSSTANILINGGGTSTSLLTPQNNIGIGNGSIQRASSTLASVIDNIALGRNALYGSSTASMTGYQNVALGAEALYANSSGNQNIAIGGAALYGNDDGTNNIALGSNALLNNVSGTHNFAAGLYALSQNVSGSDNIAIGQSALTTSGGSAVVSNNIALGKNAFYTSGAGTLSGEYNNVIGQQAFSGVFSDLQGSYNNVFGYGAMGGSTFATVNASYNNVFGSNGLRLLVDGAYNDVFGSGALSSLTAGTGTVAIGYQAGDGLTNGNRNIIIGYDVDFDNASTSLGLNIGNLIYGTNVDGTGTTKSTGNIGIGTSTPGSKLTVAGDINFTGALRTNGDAGTNGYILQTTGTGVQWVATSSLGISGGASTFLGLTDTPSSYTANRLLFTNSGATAVTDSASLVFDGTNFGLGSTTPSARLTVQGAAGSANIATFASSTGSTTLALLANGNLELGGQLISAGVEWTAQSATEANSWNSVTYGNGLFVAVSGDGTNRVMMSSDGINWSTSTAAEANTWRSITYGNGLFVAVSSDGTNRVMTSPDGINWAARSAAEANSWSSVTYGEGLFVAVAETGTNRVMTSPDGIVWTARSVVGYSWEAVAYGNGRFVAVSDFDDAMYSLDGISWTTAPVSSYTTRTSITYGNGLFVSVGDFADAMYSSDGINWVDGGYLNGLYRSVTYGNGIFVAVSADGIQTSLDAINWTYRGNPSTGIWRSVIYGNGRFVTVSSSGTNRVMVSGFTQENRLATNNIYQGGTSFMGGLRAGTTTTSVADVFFQSRSGINPFAIASSTGEQLLTLTQTGALGLGSSTPSELLTVAGNTYISGNLTAFGVTTLTNASTTNLSLSGAFYDSINSAGTAGMVLQTTGTGVQWVATSSLGISGGASTFLALTDTPSSYTANRILFASSSATSLTDSASLVFDGTNLGLGSTTPSARLTVQGAAGSANIATFASSTGSTTLALLANGNLELGGQLISAGVEWTAHNGADDDDRWEEVTYGNGLFVAVGYECKFGGTGDCVMYSSDGINWATTSAAQNNNWNSVTYGNGLFVAVAGDGTNRVMTSPDGVTWTARSAAGNNDTWLGVTYGNGLFVAVGAFSGDRVMTSPDGITWTARSVAGDNDDWRAVTYGNGLFVAVADCSGSTDCVAVSSDGVNWTAYSAAGIGDNWNSVTYGNGLFVAVGDGNNAVITSPDGITWTTRTSPILGVSVTYGNGLFVAVTNFGSPVATSPDGINWTARLGVGEDFWTAVTYGNGKFVAVSGDGTATIMTSGFTQKTELAHNNIYQGGTSFFGGLRAGTTTTSVADVFFQGRSGINPFAIASSTGEQLLTLTQTGALGLGTSTPFGAGLTIERTGLSGTTTAGIGQYLTFSNSVAAAQQFGNNTYISASNTATTTLLGSFLRIADNSVLGNTVRGFEVQSDWGANTLGENTALSGYARTFGVRGITSGDAGGSYEPAGVYGETTGTTQGNAIRGYSSTITTAALLKLFQDSSAFTGTGLLMNFGNAGGSFSSTTASRFIDLKNAGASMFTVGAYGMLTIGDGSTTTNAGIQIGYGGICVDNDGSCNASTTGRITAVEYGTNNSDLAENYFTSENLEPGEVVYLKGGLSVGRATNEEPGKIIGVVSTAPGIIMGDNDSSLTDGERAVPIGLAGRVPVRVSDENGEVEIGDALMLSSVPGVVMKASSTGQIIGRALEAFDATRAYSDTYINQFGENIIVPEYVPIDRESDPRLNDGCYYGGGARTGDEVCVPLTATTTEAQYDEADRLAAEEAKAAALAALALVPSEEVALTAEETVQIGQIVMFIDPGFRYLDEAGMAMVAALMATTTEEVEGEEVEGTLWQRLVTLAQNFVDGVLTITGLKTDRIETKELCVDGVCLNADDIRTLLNESAPADHSVSSDGGVVPEPEPEPEVVPEPIPAPTPAPESESELTQPEVASTTEPVAEEVTSTETVTEEESEVAEEEVVEEVFEEVTPEPTPESASESEPALEPEPILNSEPAAEEAA